MFHGLGQPKFYKKSKSLLKVLKTRLDTIKKKKNAVLKFMKNDIADLLKNNLDMNAYGRAEGLLIEQNISSCYDIIEQCIVRISGQVSAMLKQKYVWLVILLNLLSNSFLRYLYITPEMNSTFYCLIWFFTLFVSRECPNECREAVPTLMYAAARFADLPELRELRSLFTEKYGDSLDSYVIKEFVERLKAIPPTKEIKLLLLQDIAREFSIEWGCKALQQKLYTPPPQPAQHNPKHDESKHTKRREDEYNVPSSSEDEIGANFRRDSTSQDSRKTSSSSMGSVSEDEADNKKPFYYRFIPPPYVRNNNPAQEKSTYDEPTTNAEKNNLQDPSADDKKPRSVRRNKLKQPPGQEVIVDEETKAKQARQHAQALLNDNGEESDEEKKMDNLLRHYSNKKEPQEPSSTGGAPTHRSGKSELLLSPGRTSTSSLPTEITAKNEPFRTKSMEEDIFNQHVHPKLPDYDDLAARIAALRGQ
ncbi:hypothetical protein Dsin_000140 [Dipteronia sinensis]|uniref:IST1-like protein n=1 Tax=Dipteronia sinensis TaxID=43782 RepID=A0AAD9ZIW0_9ROSI|nr:hypothetical protein Dsin_000140 [Dipteronia sinensis]